MTQGELFESPAPSFADRRLDEKEKPRLNRQCIDILKLMAKSGRVSNADLNKIAFRYSARIYDLKQAGIAIVIVERNKETGVNWYEYATLQDRKRAGEYL